MKFIPLFLLTIFALLWACKSASYKNVLVGDTWRCVNFYYDTSVFKTFQDKAKLDAIKVRHIGFYYKFFSDSTFMYGEVSNEIDGKYFIDSSALSIELTYEKPIKHLDLGKRFRDENSLFSDGDVETSSESLNILRVNTDTLIVGNDVINYTF